MIARLIVLFVCIASAGCGAKSAEVEPAGPEVKGKVAVKGDPTATRQLEGGKVWFRSVTTPGQESVGVIDHDGSFALGTFRKAEPGRGGVPPGEYVARVEPPADSAGQSKPSPIAAKYCDYRTSGLRFSVPAPGELTIELDRAGR